MSQSAKYRHIFGEDLRVGIKDTGKLSPINFMGG